MGMSILNSSDKGLKIGNIFTPITLGEFAIKEFGIFDKWLSGASVFDPTMGIGNLLESLIIHGLRNKYSLEELPLERLFGNELNTGYYKIALQRFKNTYDVDMTKNFWNEDILKLNAKQFDIIFGNPPWQNFVDLPAQYKEKIKSHFFKYELVGNSQDLLLGGSRIDIAALIIRKSIKEFLSKNGDAYFFMPLSLFLNDGANQYFRNYKIGNVKYAPVKIIDFNDSKVFEGISTRYGLVHFKRDKEVTFPVPISRFEGNKWLKLKATPLFHSDDPLSIFNQKEQSFLSDFKYIEMPKEYAPRQGINTCGANSIFFFNSYKKKDEFTCVVNDSIELPCKFVYPLLTSANFNEEDLRPRKWVLLPYHRNGRPLDIFRIKSEEKLWEYLKSNEKVLRNRKGTLIGTWIKKGFWWALLGVGAYSFFPFKIVWEAYGKKAFNPMIVNGNWQANQSLQAFIPTRSLEEAKSILTELKNPAVEKYLLSLKMEGTMNWAQPGKIKKLIRYTVNEPTLFE